MLSFISTIFLGLIAATIGAYLQQRSWKRRSLEDLRRKEFDAAELTVENIGKAIDKRLAAQRRFLSQIQKRTADAENYKEFSEARYAWMEEFTSNKSKLYLYFGKEEMLEFENKIHQQMHWTASILQRSYELGYENLSAKHKTEHKNVSTLMSIAQRDSVQFINRLNEKVANDQIGKSLLVDNVNYGNLELISSTYLLQRLFGMKP